MRTIAPFAKRLLTTLLTITLLAFSAFAEELPEPFIENFDHPDALDGWSPGGRFDVREDKIVDGKLHLHFEGGPRNVANLRREDVVLDNFVVNAEARQLQWMNPTLGLGMVARSTRGHGYLLNLQADVLMLWNSVSGQLTLLDSQSIDFDPNQTFRLIFTGTGNELKGQALTLDGELVAEVAATHDQHTSGNVALINLAPGSTAVFDQFEAYHPDNPPDPEPLIHVKSIRQVGDWIRIIVTGADDGETLRLQSSDDLFQWTEHPGYVSPTIELEILSGGTGKYFRVFRARL